MNRGPKVTRRFTASNVKPILMIVSGGVCRFCCCYSIRGSTPPTNIFHSPHFISFFLIFSIFSTRISFSFLFFLSLFRRGSVRTFLDPLFSAVHDCVNVVNNVVYHFQSNISLHSPNEDTAQCRTVQLTHRSRHARPVVCSKIKIK